MRANKLKPGIILRYVGNRLHVMFHMAATVYHHRALLLKFFGKSCSHKGELATTIADQLGNRSNQAQLQALGLYGKIVTEPWMHVLYKNEDKLSNLQVVSKGKIYICLTTLQNIRDNREYMFNCTRDVFGDVIDSSDFILTSLRTLQPATVDLVYDLVRLLAVAFIDKLNAQLKPLITGRLSAPTDAILEDTASAPVNNMQAERTLGMMDALWRRAPNAAIGFISGKVKACQNRTLEWLEEMTDGEQTRLINFSIHQGASMRKLQAIRDKDARAATTRKRKTLVQKKNEAIMKKLEPVISSAICKGVKLVTLKEFARLDETLVIMFDRFLVDGNSMVGSRFTHAWVEDDEEVYYIEVIRAMKKKNGVLSLSLSCTRANDPEDKEEYSLPVVDFLVDWILGDVSFFTDL